MKTVPMVAELFAIFLWIQWTSSGKQNRRIKITDDTRHRVSCIDARLSAFRPLVQRSQYLLYTFHHSSWPTRQVVQ